MKVCVIFLVLLPLAFAVPEKRFFLDTIANIVDTTTLKSDLQTMVDVLGSDPTEQACEQECHSLTQQSLLDHGCPLICHSFQALLQHFRIVKDNVAPKTF